MKTFLKVIAGISIVGVVIFAIRYYADNRKIMIKN